MPRLSAEDVLSPWLPTECHVKTNQTARMRWLIWIFVGHTGCFVGNAVPQLKSYTLSEVLYTIIDKRFPYSEFRLSVPTYKFPILYSKRILGWSITKTYLYNFDPLKPHFYIVKLGFTEVYIIFLISAQCIDCGYSIYALCRNMKISEFFTWKFSFFLVVKFSIYLHRRVFVIRN